MSLRFQKSFAGMSWYGIEDNRRGLNERMTGNEWFATECAMTLIINTFSVNGCQGHG